MKQTLWIALALALAGCKDKKEAAKEPPPKTAPDAAAAPEATTLKVIPSPAEIGMTITRSDDSKMTMKIGPDAIEETETQQSVAKVVAVVPPAIAKIEIEYKTHETVRRAGSQQEQVPSPLAGKTFIVWVEGDEIKATDPAGQPVSDEALELLAIEHVELGKVPQIEQLIRAREWTQGEKVDLSGDELLSLGKARGGGDESVQPKSGSLTLVGRKGDTATFEGVMTVVKDDERAMIESTVTTTIDIDVRHGRVTAMQTTGTMKGQVKGKEPQPIEGTLENRTTASYGR
jgi:hypothetical protein